MCLVERNTHIKLDPISYKGENNQIDTEFEICSNVITITFSFIIKSLKVTIVFHFCELFMLK